MTAPEHDPAVVGWDVAMAVRNWRQRWSLDSFQRDYIRDPTAPPDMPDRWEGDDS